MTQLVFASVLGVTKQTIEKWEQGKNPVKGGTARLLYLLDKRPDLLDELYLVTTHNIEIEYNSDFAEGLNKNTIIYTQFLTQSKTENSNNESRRSDRKELMCWA